jgi:hypothetical protein
MITVQNDLIHVNFQAPFSIEDYKVFLQSKKLPEYNLKYDWEEDTYNVEAPARFAHIFGLEVPVIDRGWLPISEHLFDFQKFTAKVALDLKRYAVWFLTGCGKTHLQWELARQITHKTGGKVLLIVPLNIIAQTIGIGKDYFGITDCVQLTSRDHLKAWCVDKQQGIAIVNPDKFIPKKDEPEIISECHQLNGVLLDEASLLASGGGKIKWALIKSCKGIEYKYTFTATPARNSIMDYASQGSFLEKLRNENDILWTYFQRNKAGEWDIRPHAEKAFYRFMSGWSVYLIDPKHYGFDDYLKDLPAPQFIEHHIPLTEEQRKLVALQPDRFGQLNLFGKNREKLTLQERSKYSQLAKGFSYNGTTVADHINSNKPAYIANLIKQEASEGLQPIVWTIFDEESKIIELLLRDSGFKIGVLHGKLAKEKRPAIIEAFRAGQLDVLITKASLLGFGLNFQNCASMIFSGFDDSFEKQFQAVRRSYRYGQKRSVRIHIPYIPELEGVVWNNVCQKQERYDMETRIMEDHYRDAMKHLLKFEGKAV